MFVVYDNVIEGCRLSNAIQNRKQGKAGPFCSRSCAGKYGANVQNGKIAIEPEDIEASYTTNKLNRAFQEKS